MSEAKLHQLLINPLPISTEPIIHNDPSNLPLNSINNSLEEKLLSNAIAPSSMTTSYLLNKAHSDIFPLCLIENIAQCFIVPHEQRNNYDDNTCYYWKLEGTPQQDICNNIKLINFEKDLEAYVPEHLDPILHGTSLGKGTYGTVTRFRHKATNDVYAIKSIDKSVVCESGMTNQVESEIRFQISATHPNVLKCYGCLEDKHSIRIFMQCCDKGDLYQIMRSRPMRRFNESEAFYYLMQLVNGLSYIHSKGYFHRDLKLENILVGSDNRLKIADFGWIGLIVGSRANFNFCGTLDYLCPEMVQGSGHDWRTDIWGLGILLYEMLTGTPPFHSLNPQTLVFNILEHHMTFPTYISQAAQDVINALLQPVPEQRVTLSGLLHFPWIQKQWFSYIENRIFKPFRHYVRQTDKNKVLSNSNESTIDTNKNNETICHHSNDSSKDNSDSNYLNLILNDQVDESGDGSTKVSDSPQIQIKKKKVNCNNNYDDDDENLDFLSCEQEGLSSSPSCISTATFDHAKLNNQFQNTTTNTPATCTPASSEKLSSPLLTSFSLLSENNVSYNSQIFDKNCIEPIQQLQEDPSNEVIANHNEIKYDDAYSNVIDNCCDNKSSQSTADGSNCSNVGPSSFSSSHAFFYENVLQKDNNYCHSDNGSVTFDLNFPNVFNEVQSQTIINEQAEQLNSIMKLQHNFKEANNYPLQNMEPGNVNNNNNNNNNNNVKDLDSSSINVFNDIMQTQNDDHLVQINYPIQPKTDLYLQHSMISPLEKEGNTLLWIQKHQSQVLNELPPALAAISCSSAVIRHPLTPANSVAASNSLFECQLMKEEERRDAKLLQNQNHSTIMEFKVAPDIKEKLSKEYLCENNTNNKILAQQMIDNEYNLQHNTTQPPPPFPLLPNHIIMPSECSKNFSKGDVYSNTFNNNTNQNNCINTEFVNNDRYNNAPDMITTFTSGYPIKQYSSSIISPQYAAGGVSAPTVTAASFIQRYNKLNTTCVQPKNQDDHIIRSPNVSQMTTLHNSHQHLISTSPSQATKNQIFQRPLFIPRCATLQHTYYPDSSSLSTHQDNRQNIQYQKTMQVTKIYNEQLQHIIPSPNMSGGATKVLVERHIPRQHTVAVCYNYKNGCVNSPSKRYNRCVSATHRNDTTMYVKHASPWDTLKSYLQKKV